MAIIYRNPHEQSYLAAKQELEQLTLEQQQLNQRVKWVAERISQLDAYLKAVTPLLQEEPGQNITEAGLTELCRELLDQQQKWMTPQEIRHLLSLIGVDLSGYTNPMAVLHAVLKRVGQSAKDENGSMVFAALGVPPYVMPPPTSIGEMMMNLGKAPNKIQPSAQLKKQFMEGPKNFIKRPDK